MLDPNLYQPSQLDTDQWLDAAKGAGARYAVFTATHFNGFMQWQSDLYPYGLRQTSWRGGEADVVGDFVASCERAGIAPAIYFSTHRNAYWTVWGHYVDWGEGRGTAKQARFNAVAEKMTQELCSRYGPLLQIWFDSGVLTPAEGGPDVLPVFERHQPDGVFYHNMNRAGHRWIGNEEGFAHYPCWATMPGGDVSHRADAWKPLLESGDPDGAVWSPGMVDVPLRGAADVHNWFWNPDQEYGLHSIDALVQMYYDSVGRNCNFVMGAVVDPEGAVPEADVERLRGAGYTVLSPAATLASAQTDIAEAPGVPEDSPRRGFVTGLLIPEAPETFELTLERGGERLDVTVDAVPLDVWRGAAAPEPGFTLEGREAGMIEPGIAYLRPGPFYNIDAATPEEAYDPGALSDYINFIDTSFEGFIAEGAQTLILDLRDNPGGDSSFSDPVVAWFADEPFSFTSQFRLRVSPETTASNQRRVDARPEGAAGVSGEYAALFAEAENGDVVLFDFPMIAPREGRRFDGEVLVLVNRHTYSNAVTTAALIQDYGFGTLIGEPSLDMATAFGAMERFTLPNSGWSVGYPKAHIIRPSGREDLHPVTPDVMLELPAVRGARDAALEAAVARARP